VKPFCRITLTIGSVILEDLKIHVSRPRRQITVKHGQQYIVLSGFTDGGRQTTVYIWINVGAQLRIHGAVRYMCASVTRVCR